MAASPQYAATPKIGIGQLSSANANRDGTGTIVAVITAGASGTRVERAMVKATAATTAGMVRLFIHDGTNAMLFAEIPVAAITPSASVAAFEDEVVFEDGLVLPTGYSLRASTHNAEAFNVIAMGADL